MKAGLSAGEHVHFVGIGGIGMSSLARLLVSKGYEVSGSDSSPGEQSLALAALGARVHTGHDASHLDGADLVVYTSAVSPDNPEIEAARERRIPVLRRAELLAQVANAGRGVAIAGTHGKTTTSALIGWMLFEAGLDPTVLIGGISTNFGSNARMGSDLVVAEADEYDGSFLQLRPKIGIITNVEPDHLDFYQTVEALHSAFAQFAGSVEETLVVCADDPFLAELQPASSARRLTYGLTAGELRGIIKPVASGPTEFDVIDGNKRQTYRTSLAGRHNVLNCLAAIAVGHVLCVEDEAMKHALESFSGVGRRFETIGEVAGVLVMDDYAHHPTEIRATVRAIRDRFNRPVRVVFQPHTFSRTKALMADFARSFADADSVYLLDVYAAREWDNLGISGRDLAVMTASHHGRVRYTETMDETEGAVLEDIRGGDVVVTMGAGDVHTLAPRLLARLVAQ